MTETTDKTTETARAIRGAETDLMADLVKSLTDSGTPVARVKHVKSLKPRLAECNTLNEVADLLAQEKIPPGTADKVLEFCRDREMPQGDPLPTDAEQDALAEVANRVVDQIADEQIEWDGSEVRASAGEQSLLLTVGDKKLFVNGIEIRRPSRAKSRLLQVHANRSGENDPERKKRDKERHAPERNMPTPERHQPERTPTPTRLR